MVVLVAPGPFSSNRLVPASLAVLASDIQEVRQTRTVDPSAEWVLGLELPGESSTKEKRWYGYTAELAAFPTASSESEAQSKTPEYYREGDAVPLATCGLLWRDHGKAIIQKIAQEEGLEPLGEEWLLKLHRKIYESTIQALDAKSLGIKRCDICTDVLFTSWTSFEKMMFCLDPWMDGISGDAETLKRRHEALQKAVAETVSMVRNSIKGLLVEWMPAVDVVQRALAAKDQWRQGSQVVIVLDRFVPWREHLYNLEDECNITEESEQVKWVVFQDDRSGQWRATAPAKRGERFANRALLHEDLRGLRDAELVAKSGIEGATFVHHSGFTGGAASLESMLKMISYGV